MINSATTEKFKNIKTPFYYYDLDVLRSNLDIIKEESENRGFKVHYAVKANANPRILSIIASYGLGADCVSWNEIDAAIAAGFNPSDIVFAGVGKSDFEIESAIKKDIFCFNCESIAEIEVINQIAKKNNKTASIALRINPSVDAHTHKKITTGVADSKFGINIWELDNVVELLPKMSNLKLIGIHFHIGSQISKMPVYKDLCIKVNELQEWFSTKNIDLPDINIGGGLAIDYEDPEKAPPFREYFALLDELINLKPEQTLHMEPGRSITGQCGNLISKVLFIKEGINTKFAVIDAGMTELMRPALYQARHKIENLTSVGKVYKYDVVGPICESSDTFDRGIELPETNRGDIVAIRSAGAYGETMASRYNLRELPASVFSDDLF